MTTSAILLWILVKTAQPLPLDMVAIFPTREGCEQYAEQFRKMRTAPVACAKLEVVK